MRVFQIITTSCPSCFITTYCNKNRTAETGSCKHFKVVHLNFICFADLHHSSIRTEDPQQKNQYLKLSPVLNGTRQRFCSSNEMCRDHRSDN